MISSVRDFIERGGGHIDADTVVSSGSLDAALRAAGALVIWRCHVGLDTPNDLAREAWAFLRPYLLEADAYVFSRENFV